MKLLCKICHENIPSHMLNVVEGSYMMHRNEIVDVFNEHISQVNEEWDKTGKPCSIGESDYPEDINPEYTEFVNQHIQPFIDVLNEKYSLVKYKLDEFCDIVGYIPFIEGSKIWVLVKPE